MEKVMLSGGPESMPRASRHYLPGHAWHITHRCNKKEFLVDSPRIGRTGLTGSLRPRSDLGLPLSTRLHVNVQKHSSPHS